MRRTRGNGWRAGGVAIGLLLAGRASVQGATNRLFTMDGVADSAAFTVFPDTMKILAAVRGSNLYVATWAVHETAGAADHFIYVTDELGAAVTAPWDKGGSIFFDKARKPYLAAEGENDWEGWSNVNAWAENRPGDVLEGEFNLVDAFGRVPAAVYIAAVAYGTASGAALTSQGPHTWNGDGNLDITEFQRVPLASIRDDNADGYFDSGAPRLWTVVNGATNDANYGLRRFFLDELAGETQALTVVLQPNTAPGAVLSNVELFSNLNRREFAVLPGDEDWSRITAATLDRYYRAYPMAPLADGRYTATVPVTQCGAFRVTARYRVDGGPYVYYTDNGLRRDAAIVVSPRKALATTLYELNPLFAEATNDLQSGRSTFRDLATVNTDRPDVINPDHFNALGVNMVWLQPIHPIGAEGQSYSPGSPYAVRNYWQVNPLLGNPATPEQALGEFRQFVSAMDRAGVGVMLDGTFNHSAWDCEVGAVAAGLFPWATNAAALIRAARPAWYSRKNNYGAQATGYQDSGNHDLAVAPDRIDFGKWSDAADFFYGTYDCLVQQPAADTNNAWSSPWHKRYLLEEDRFDGFPNAAAREVWQYFAHYPVYWLEQTGHPAGTPKDQSARGIDGLRCDFAQGLPSAFWEYCINRTRAVKWDFLFMAESLDGYATVGGSRRHGVGYRSARHFDILNENLVFYWRDTFFSYFNQPQAQPLTQPTWQAFDDRRNAFDAAPLLLNLTSHDEILPADNAYRVLYAFAELSALHGVPMLFYGQEAGLQNDAATYGGVPNADHNFAHYESNFGKAIPNFKRFNDMRSIWANRDWTLQTLYGRIGRARLASPALRSPADYFLVRTDTTDYDPDIFAVAKVEQPGVNAATQDVVFVFVNNDFAGGANRSARFKLDVAYNGRNRFGIDPARAYNVVNLLSPTPTNTLWSAPKAGATLLAEGIWVGLSADPYQGGQAQFLKLIDAAVGPLPPDADADGLADFSDADDDNDSLPDAWESAHNLDPRNATGVYGRNGDKDGDGLTNWQEFQAGTDPDDRASTLRLAIAPRGAACRLQWDSIPEHVYELQAVPRLEPAPPWQRRLVTTAAGTTLTVDDMPAAGTSNQLYRVRVLP